MCSCYLSMKRTQYKKVIISVIIYFITGLFVLLVRLEVCQKKVSVIFS
jgi:hypothetical protein